jgi:hypothetical protein
MPREDTCSSPEPWRLETPLKTAQALHPLDLFKPFDIAYYHDVSVVEYDQLMLSYKRVECKFDVQEGVLSLHDINGFFFEKSRRIVNA